MFVQGATNKKVFCYCTGCGIAFSHPKYAQAGEGLLEDMKHLYHFSPDAIVLPSKEAIDKAGYSNWVSGTSSESEWYSESEINEDYEPRIT